MIYQRSHIPAANALTMIDTQHTWEGRTIPKGGEAAPSMRQGILGVSQSFAPTLKRGRPLGLKDLQPQKRKLTPTSNPNLNLTIAHSFVPMHEVILDYGDASEETCRPPEIPEISVHYAVLDEVWNMNEMIVSDAFAYSVANDIMLNDDNEPHFVDECLRRTDWSK